MMPHHSLPSANPELQELRHRYNRLCARFVGVSNADPLAASDTVQELQSLSDRIVAIEEMQDEGKARERQQARPVARFLGPRPLDKAANEAANGKAGAPGLAMQALAARPAPDLSLVDIAAFARLIGEDPDSPRFAPDRHQDQAVGHAPRIVERSAPRQHAEAASEKATEAVEEQPAVDFDRLYRAIQGQEAQIAAVLRRCEEHQQQLEAMERRLAEHYPAKLLASQLEALSASLDHQRQRVTSLAIAIQRLLHWLAAERRLRQK
jgi:hypothetical protein